MKPSIIWKLFLLVFLSCDGNSRKTKCNYDGQIEKKVIYSIAKSIIKKKNNNQIWNLSGIDTSNFRWIEDYFTNTKTKNKLVLISGSAGLSAGTADNLLILFESINTRRVIWSGQVGDISFENIKDLNNDGIKELICSASAQWMGECNQSYNIFNFEGGQQTFLYRAISTSIIDCGREGFGDLYKKGDTLETKTDCSLFKSNKSFNLRQIKTVKIHNGGKTDIEIIKNLKIFTDTITLLLK